MYTNVGECESAPVGDECIPLPVTPITALASIYKGCWGVIACRKVTLQWRHVTTAVLCFLANKIQVRITELAVASSEATTISKYLTDTCCLLKITIVTISRAGERHGEQVQGVFL